MERMLTRQDFDRAIEGALGRDRWYPLDEVGLRWGDAGNPFGAGPLEVSVIEYLHDGIVLCGDAAAGGGANHIARSTYFGTKWTDLGAAVVGSYVFGIAYLGGTFVVTAHMNGHIGFSDDDGATWADLGDQTGGGNLSALASLGSGWAVAAMAAAASVLRTQDYGETWAPVAAPAPHAGWWRWVKYLGRGRVLMGGDGISVALSRDYGGTWQDIATQFPGQTGTYFAENLGDGVALIVSNEMHVWRTEDYGESWTPQGPIPGATSYGPIGYCGDGIVVAGTGGLMLARSADYGRSWTPIGGVPGGTSVYTIRHLERGIVLTGGRAPRINRSEPAMLVA